MAGGILFLSAVPTAQNCPELHFRFINLYIRSSLLEYLVKKQNYFMKSHFWLSSKQFGQKPLFKNIFGLQKNQADLFCFDQSITFWLQFGRCNLSRSKNRK